MELLSAIVFPAHVAFAIDFIHSCVPKYLNLAQPTLPPVTVGWSIYRWKLSLWSFDGAVWVLTSTALLIGVLFARLFALSVQDRVIRLEEQLRCHRLLSPALLPRISELEHGQFVALRFASDAELSTLVQKVLDEKLKDRKAIKQLIKTWRPDYLRA